MSLLDIMEIDRIMPDYDTKAEGGAEHMLAALTPILASLRTTYKQACEHEKILAETSNTVRENIASANQELCKASLRAWNETVDNPACDSRALAEQLSPIERHSAFLQN
ncbi:MAG: hypothetical protein WBY44_24715, partial [Bryobacteraceae bacterium]